MVWHKIIPFKKLQREKVCVYKRPLPECAIALFWADTHIYALENRCPHQGYPLDDAFLDTQTGTLTCNRHMWSFALHDGHCRQAGARLKLFQTKVEDEHVWIDC